MTASYEDFVYLISKVKSYLAINAIRERHVQTIPRLKTPPNTPSIKLLHPSLQRIWQSGMAKNLERMAYASGHASWNGDDAVKITLKYLLDICD